MTEFHKKSFAVGRKLGFLAAIDIIQKNPGLSANRILAKLQIEHGYSEEKGQNMLKVLTIDKRIRIEDGKVYVNEIENQ